ncbi:NADH-quinone oxidoreductase subunit J family protein [Deinococcus peraridilitoris]|uniref:NADH-quinone oxidoreductase subunit J n=1 Tax=Deinococcus peraridilitoris (strain DSM 19664 / LMG 22246 / CIP 109416 / KR-200) TaxID=937777 RepID=L0A6V8_DEIPD|nr:NADH-quinone oxidoreductase subunit J [Deinococcus peraridilitoris]AFZ68775.1 NADH:ubiquinone oxidoreductase subunit 6 (chain J) [Deinococcus peraridilitoris DSM 19664]
MSSLAFILISLLIITGALVTVIASNALHAALGLVATLVALAMMYITLDAHFLGAVQVIVYAGAIMVLFLFVIMLLNATAPVTATNPIPYVGEVAALGGALLAGAFGLLALSWRDPRPLAEGAALLRNGTPGAIGETLLTRFVMPFEAVSILLLVAVVGSVVLIRRPVAQSEEAPEARPVETGERVST